MLLLYLPSLPLKVFESLFVGLLRSFVGTEALSLKFVDGPRRLLIGRCLALAGLGGSGPVPGLTDY